MKEKLEAKLKELQVGQAQATANVHAYGGAIQVVQQLLDEIQAEMQAELSKDVVKAQE